MTEAFIHKDGIWLDVADTLVSFNLPNEGLVLFSYELPVVAHKNYSTVAHDMFTATQTTRARGFNNFLQVRE